jgi:hypothetical protein
MVSTRDTIKTNTQLLTPTTSVEAEISAVFVAVSAAVLEIDLGEVLEPCRFDEVGVFVHHVANDDFGALEDMQRLK